MTVEQGYRSWRIRAKSYPSGEHWGVLVEAFPSTGGAGIVVPFTERFGTEHAAADAGIAAGKAWVDRRTS